MKTIRLTNGQAKLLTGVIETLSGDEEKKYYLGNGEHPAYRRSVFLSDLNCAQLFMIKQKIDGSGK